MADARGPPGVPLCSWLLAAPVYALSGLVALSFAFMCGSDLQMTLFPYSSSAQSYPLLLLIYLVNAASSYLLCYQISIPISGFYVNSVFVRGLPLVLNNMDDMSDEVVNYLSCGRCTLHEREVGSLCGAQEQLFGSTARQRCRWFAPREVSHVCRCNRYCSIFVFTAWLTLSIVMPCLRNSWRKRNLAVANFLGLSSAFLTMLKVRLVGLCVAIITVRRRLAGRV